MNQEAVSKTFWKIHDPLSNNFHMVEIWGFLKIAPKFFITVFWYFAYNLISDDQTSELGKTRDPVLISK